LKRIEEWAFKGCDQLHRPKRQKGVSIHRDAYKCSFLTSVLNFLKEFYFSYILFILIVLTMLFSFFFPILKAIELAFITIVVGCLAIFLFILFLFRNGLPHHN